MFRLRAACHRHVRPPPAFATHLLCNHIHQFTRFDSVGKIGCHTGNQADLAIGYRCQNDGGCLEFILELVQGFTQRRRIRTFQLSSEHFDAIAIHRLADKIIPLRAGKFRFQSGQLFFQNFGIIQNLQDALGSFLRLCLYRVGHLLQLPLLLLHISQRTLAGHRFHAPYTGCDAALGDDLEQPDVPGALHMRASAQFAR